MPSKFTHLTKKGATMNKIIAGLGVLVAVVASAGFLISKLPHK